MAYAPASNADAIRFIFRGVQKVSQKNRPLRKTGAIFRVPFFFELFGFLCNFGYSARKPPKGAINYASEENSSTDRMPCSIGYFLRTALSIDFVTAVTYAV